MLTFMVTTQSGKLVGSALRFIDAIAILRKQVDAGRDHLIYLADENAIDVEDPYLDPTRGIAIVSAEGLIIPLDGSDFIPGPIALSGNVSGLADETACMKHLREPCPQCNGLGDAEHENDEASLCQMCASRNTLADAVLLALHRASRLEASNPIVRLVTHLIRGDKIHITPVTQSRKL